MDKEKMMKKNNQIKMKKKFLENITNQTKNIKKIFIKKLRKIIKWKNKKMKKTGKMIIKMNDYFNSIKWLFKIVFIFKNTFKISIILLCLRFLNYILFVYLLYLFLLLKNLWLLYNVR